VGFARFEEDIEMKKAMLLALAALFIASSVFAAPDKGYIGIYNDANHSVCSVYPPQYVPFDVWVWCLPSVHGLQAAEFRVVFPPTIITTATVQNPGITVALGSLTDGISVAYGNCNVDWVYTHHLTCMALAAGVPGYVSITANPSAGKYQFANCEPGYPTEDCTIINNLAINQQCLIGTQTSTWGAIKNLF